MRQTSMKRALPLAAVFAVVGAVLGFACGKYESCDPGQVLQYNICLPAVADAGHPDTGAATDAAASCRPPNFPDAGPSTCTGPAAGFGDPCTADDQCRCGKDLCAVIPGETCGFCTRSGCMADPSICPAGWKCFDASAFQPGYSLCVNF
jgi:hypothetical protein